MSNPYKKRCPYNEIDIYRVLDIYNVKSHSVGHAIKKLLCAGQRGNKGYFQDISEAIKSLERELDMITEDIQHEIKK